MLPSRSTLIPSGPTPGEKSTTVRRNLADPSGARSYASSAIRPFATGVSGGRSMKLNDPSSSEATYSVAWSGDTRSEEHTSELQSHSDLVCRLLLEKKKLGGRRKVERKIRPRR